MKNRFLLALLWLNSVVTLCADEPLAIETFRRLGSEAAMTFPLQPGIKEYTFFSTTNLNSPFLTNSSFNFLPYGRSEFIVDNVSATVVGSWTTATTSTDKY